MAETLQCEVTRSESGSLVELTGELDAASVPRLTEAIEVAVGDVTLDLAGLTFCDAAGLTALVLAHDELRGRSRRLAIRGAPPILLRLIEITGLNTKLRLAGSTAAQTAE